MQLLFCIPSSWSSSGSQEAEIPVQAGAFLHRRCKPTHLGDVFGQEGPMSPGWWQMSHPAGFLHKTQLDGSICLPCCSMTFPRAASKTGGWQSREEEEEVVAEKWLRGPEPTKCHVHHGLPSPMVCGARMGCVLSPNLPLPCAVGRRNPKIGINKGNAVFRAAGCVPGVGKGSSCQHKQPSQVPPVASPRVFV